MKYKSRDSLIWSFGEVIKDLNRLQLDIKTQQNSYNQLISKIVSLHQEYRITKQYEISDQLRNLLYDVGVVIVQGKKGMEFSEIKHKNMCNVQVEDT